MCKVTHLLAWAGCDTMSAGLNLEFSFSWTGFLNKTKKTCLLYCLPIARGRTNEFITFSVALARNETQIAPSKIWTRVDDFSFNDDNRHTSLCAHAHACMCVCVSFVPFQAFISILSFTKAPVKKSLTPIILSGNPQRKNSNYIYYK